MSEASLQTPETFYNENLYVLLEGVLGSEFCEELTAHMFKLHEQGILEKDAQCPSSDAVYGDPLFDNLLEKLATPIGTHLGTELIPTYTYARIYRPGEVLERHTDRPACEISGTMTLGFDGKQVWPIYVAKNPDDMSGKRVDLKIGDMLMYRGEQLTHWRPEFKGEWQCQVFFHYVDANGPHADTEKFDGRPELGIQKRSATPIPVADEETEALKEKITTEIVKDSKRDGVFPIFDGVMIPSWDLELPGIISITPQSHPNIALTTEECDAVIDMASETYADKGTIGSGKEGAINTDVRNVNLFQIPLTSENKWLFDKIARAVSISNAEHFDFDIMGITHELQLLHYESGKEPGHYNWHMDIGNRTSSTRKISVSIQLTDPKEYEGGILTVNSNGMHIDTPEERGTMTMFPSYCMHRVTPMERGERWALVIWVHGSKRFR